MSRKEQPFEGVFGNTVELRLFEHLLSLPKVDFNVTELHRISGVSRPMVDKTVKKFLKWNIVRSEGKRSNMPFYSLNEEGNIVQAFYLVNDAMMQEMYPELFEGPDAPCAAPMVSIEDIHSPNATDGYVSGTFSFPLTRIGITLNDASSSRGLYCSSDNITITADP